MSDVKNPHDQYFKKSMENPRVAQDFFRHFLPKHILKRVDLSTLSLQSTSFIDAQLKNRFSDLVFEVSCDGGIGYIYLLIEHQRKGDPLMALRMLEYSTQLMRRHVTMHKTHVLPLVIPIVFYNGDEPYMLPADGN